MTMSRTLDDRCRLLTIFEGPDGSGKTSAAMAYAAATGARYVHLGPLLHVGAGLARMYVEAMLPALLGYKNVVMDRCWMSEPIYGAVHRGGVDRLGPIYTRMLERVALRSAAVVVRCDVPFEVAAANWWSRRADDGEMLKCEDDFRAVFERYQRRDHQTALNVYHYDYTKEELSSLCTNVGRIRRLRPHKVRTASAGAWPDQGSGRGVVILVGERFAEPKAHDPLTQYPFVSFNAQGASAWLTSELDAAGIGEDQFLWVNADQPGFKALPWPAANRVIALGDVAQRRLQLTGVTHDVVPHPSYWYRFRHGEPYPLIQLLKGAHS